MKRLVFLGRVASLLLAAFCAFPSGISAQEFRATVTGRVTDPAGLPMPGVTVTATNTQTNEAASAVTGGEGLYSLPFLRPGIYTVTAELEGFRKYSREKVQLEVGQAQTINIALADRHAHRDRHGRQRGRSRRRKRTAAW